MSSARVAVALLVAALFAVGALVVVVVVVELRERNGSRRSCSGGG
jgi:hypothetical protein